jgi:hypothetical protein
MKPRPLIVVGMLVAATLLCANVAHGQSQDTVKVDTMEFTLVGPAVKGDSFVTVRRVRGILDKVEAHVDEMTHGFMFLRATTAEAQQRTDSLRFVVDSLKAELKKRICSAEIVGSRK